MSIRDVANWALDQSAWWLLPFLTLWAIATVLNLVLTLLGEEAG